MAYARTTLTHLDRFGLKARYTWLVDALAERAARRKVYRQTVAELQALSDRDLADFGFHRSEIPRVAKEAADRA